MNAFKCRSNIIHNLKYVRVKNGLTQTQIGELLNVSTTTASFYERGYTCIPAYCIWVFCQHFNLDMNDFLTKKF